MLFFRTLVASGVALASAPAFGQEPLYVIRGHGANFSAIGDLDGDGATDLVSTEGFGIGPLSAHSGRTGRLLFHLVFDSSVRPETAATLGDIDGDGVPDLALGAAVYSGSDLLAGSPTPLFPLAPPAGSIGPLGGVARLDDLDGDGIPEVLLGWPDEIAWGCPGGVITTLVGATGGAARIHSGLDGRVLRSHTEPVPDSGFGGIVAALGDVNGDGTRDYAVGTRKIAGRHPYLCQLPGATQTSILSGATGELLWRIQEAPRALAPLADLDGDGRDEVVLDHPYGGRVDVRSGSTGRLLQRLLDPLRDGAGYFGHAVAIGGDVFGAGAPTLFVAVPQPVLFPIGVPGSPESSGPGGILAISLSRRARVEVILGSENGEELGAEVAYLGDVNGDGVPELAIGIARSPRGDGTTESVIRVRSLDLLPATTGATPVPGQPQGTRP